MTISTETVRSFSDVLAGQVLNDVLTNFKSGSNDQLFSSDKVRTMNGTILSNHVNHLDNFKKLQENDMITSENANSDKSKAGNVESSASENKKLGPFQEEMRDSLNNNDSSDEAVSSLTSDTDSNSNATLTDSTEEEVEFFPAKKSGKHTTIHSEGLDKPDKTHNSELVNTTNQNYPNASTQTKVSISETIPSSSTTASQNVENINVDNHDGTVNGEISRENPEQNNPNMENLNQLQRRLSPLDITSQRNEHKQDEDGQVNDSLSNTGLQLIPTTSSDYSEPLTSGNSDIVIPTALNREPPDLIKGNLNGNVSDDSDLNDHARILAELQKIVHDDEMNDGGQSKDDGATAGEDGQRSTEIVVKDSPQNNKVLVRNNGGSDHQNTSNGDHDTYGANVQSNGTQNGYHGNNQHNKRGSNSNLKNDADSSDTKLNPSARNGAKNEPKHDHEHKNGDDGSANGHLDKSNSKLHAGTHEKGTSHHEDKLDDNNSGTISTDDHQNGQRSGQFDGSGNKNTMQGPPINMIDNEQGGAKTYDSTSKTQHTTQTLSNTNLRAKTNQPPNTAIQDHSLENLERKLSNLQISNKEQTEEIRRLKALNQSLKAKFEKLEQSSSHQRDIEEKMLQRNEELEKHLLGMLKSQEIIFDMKENLKAASADNEKLTKDYKEAVKALEAVDKLFGQKDALVKKWKEATEESRQLVELLKKHNAEVGDLETVDKLKEEIASLKGKFSKAEERNETTCVRNEELVQQSRMWKEKYERENEQAIKLNFELQEVTKELKNHQKLAGKRGRKNQMLQLEVTELKDTLKLAKEKLAENERRLKETERKYADSQEMYTKIIHQKEMQHSVLIKNSESYQKDLVANIENAENLRKEAESLKGNIAALEEEKMKVAERLKNNEKSLEDTLNIKAELSTQLAKLQSDFEASKIEAVDNELYIEEQTVLLQELEEQCTQLQSVLKQYIHSGGGRRNRRPSTAPNRYGRRLRPSQTWPSHPQLDMYRQLLSPPRGLPSRRKPSPKREAKYRVQITDKNDSEDTLEDGSKKYEEFQRSYLHSNRPKSTYGNRSLSINNNQDRYHDRAHSSKDWVPKIVLVDSQKLESSSEADSGSVTADQYAMQYVKLGDKVLFELSVEGKKQNIPGVVKYVGPVYHSNFKSGIYAGLKLDLPIGDTNGTVGDRVYFNCLKKHGKFVKLSHILAVQNYRTQQYTRILPMAYK